jgi:hypothetical protein
MILSQKKKKSEMERQRFAGFSKPSQVGVLSFLNLNVTNQQPQRKSLSRKGKSHRKNLSYKF